MTQPDFGLESQFRLQPITSKQDALTLLVHFVLSKNGWKFTGRGDAWPDNESTSEMLPSGWQQTGDSFRYVSQSDPKKKFIVKYVILDKFLLVSMISMNDESTVSMNINMSTEVNESELSSNNPRRVYPNLLTLINTIYDQLVRPCEVATRSIGTSTRGTASSKATPSAPAAGPSPRQHDPPDPNRPAPRIFPGFSPEMPLGRRDLDPFAGPGSGGGMIMDPSRNDPLRIGPPRHGPDGVPLPPGAAPPGARFDPFGPPGIDPFSGDPDNDLFMPPGGFPGRRGGGGSSNDGPGGFGGLGGFFGR